MLGVKLYLRSLFSHLLQKIRRQTKFCCDKNGIYILVQLEQYIDILEQGVNNTWLGKSTDAGHDHSIAWVFCWRRWTACRRLSVLLRLVTDDYRFLLKPRQPAQCWPTRGGVDGTNRHSKFVWRTSIDGGRPDKKGRYLSPFYLSYLVLKRVLFSLSALTSPVVRSTV